MDSDYETADAEPQPAKQRKSRTKAPEVEKVDKVVLAAGVVKHSGHALALMDVLKAGRRKQEGLADTGARVLNNGMQAMTSAEESSTQESLAVSAPGDKITGGGGSVVVVGGGGGGGVGSTEGGGGGGGNDGRVVSIASASGNNGSSNPAGPTTVSRLTSLVNDIVNAGAQGVKRMSLSSPAAGAGAGGGPQGSSPVKVKPVFKV